MSENQPEASVNLTEKKKQEALTQIDYGAVAWDIAKQLGGSLGGGDILSAEITLPSIVHEPLSILQRGVEIFRYAKILEEAAKHKNSINRMAYIAGFFCSPFSTTCGRFKTNFNPVLGETFEYIDDRFPSPVKIFVEQVQPQMTAMHAFNDHWTVKQQYSASANFHVNALEIKTNSQTHIIFPDGDHYYALNPDARIHNILLGSMWIEHYGEIAIQNIRTGEKCVVDFPKAKFFEGKPQYKVKGGIYDRKGKKLVELEGRWDKHLTGTWRVETDEKDFVKGSEHVLWLDDPVVIKHEFKFSEYADSLNDFPEELQKTVLCSDSRRRPDRRCLEKGDCDGATFHKKTIETKHRSDNTARVINQLPWKPNWFELGKDHEGRDYWNFTNKYWDLYEKASKDEKKVEVPALQNMACNFCSSACD